MQQEVIQAQGDNDRQIGQESIGKQDLPDDRNIRKAGDRGAVGRRSRLDGDLADAACQLGQRAAEEVSEADAEGGQRKTDDVLVCPEGDGQDTVDQTAEHRHEDGKQERDQDAQKSAGVLSCCFLIEEARDQARNSAHVHDAGNTEVQVPGFLCQDLAGCTEKDRNALHDGALYKCQNDFHYASSPFFLNSTL